MRHLLNTVTACAAALMLTACQQESATTEVATTASEPTHLDVTDAQVFVAKAERILEQAGQASERASWVYQNFITEDTEAMSASAKEKLTAAEVAMAAEAARFNDVSGLDADTRRKLDTLRSSIIIPAPMDAAKTTEQAEIGAKLAPRCPFSQARLSS